ncbi:hypothetical protein F6R98_12740 [Candidatus Methylospira mobilis]|uniref:Uncharacterized protein n=1 Tax=Candidatus Methylospira mobilis TaxID=1808979 RepID=A0A5Q0BMQ0_9GAMM|nr:hypothetical protein [Candidatus Methylospira mobilis]QFY43377.1 hypothetical protein F6R98_12740 [Candidatus Methylospira mobilis]WNV03404.1 hypothetical protein RP726_13180 [Candidatus Methylospira mobilis]
MDIETLNALRSPSGLPSHPVIFLILLVVTWTLHILAVQVMLGSTALSVIGVFVNDGFMRKLGNIMLNTAKVAVSIAIVLGVAPLLFVQVIYDPFWYVSNVLSARWVIAFIFILLAAYWAMYHRYFASKDNADDQQSGRWSLVASLVLLLLVGFIMHVLVSQMLRPELWMGWYAPGGHIDSTGSTLHEFNLWRFIYFISLSVPVIGAWLIAYRQYLGLHGPNATFSYWVGRLGTRLMSAGGLASLLFYVLWLSTLPDSAASFTGSIWALLMLGATLVLALCPLLNSCGRSDYYIAAVAAVAVLCIAMGREALRIGILHGVHGYNLFDYPVHFDAYSTLLFFGTFIFLGLPAVAYSIVISWESGRTIGIYTASPLVTRLGSISLVALGVWIAQYFLFGFMVLLQGEGR